MDVYGDIQRERDLSIGGCALQWRTQRSRRGPSRTAICPVIDIRHRIFAVTHIDAARQCSMVGRDTVVRNLQVVVPAMNEDSTAALRAVEDAETIDARRVSVEIAGAVIV